MIPQCARNDAISAGNRRRRTRLRAPVLRPLFLFLFRRRLLLFGLPRIFCSRTSVCWQAHILKIPLTQPVTMCSLSPNHIAAVTGVSCASSMRWRLAPVLTSQTLITVPSIAMMIWPSSSHTIFPVHCEHPLNPRSNASSNGAVTAFWRIGRGKSQECSANECYRWPVQFTRWQVLFNAAKKTSGSQIVDELRCSCSPSCRLLFELR